MAFSLETYAAPVAIGLIVLLCLMIVAVNINAVDASIGAGSDEHFGTPGLDTRGIAHSTSSATRGGLAEAQKITPPSDELEVALAKFSADGDADRDVSADFADDADSGIFKAAQTSFNIEGHPLMPRVASHYVPAADAEGTRSGYEAVGPGGPDDTLNTELRAARPGRRGAGAALPGLQRRSDSW